MPFNSSSKSGKFFDINRASTLAFRAIGRGQLAAAKTLSILGLPKPFSKLVWCENTKIIADACSELVRKELEHSARELKEPVETDGEGYCSTAVSFFFPLRDFLFVGLTFPTTKKKGMLATEYFTFHQADVLTKHPVQTTDYSVTCAEADWLELIKVQVGAELQ